MGQRQCTVIADVGYFFFSWWCFGLLDVLQWVRRKGCPWYGGTCCISMFSNGHIPTVVRGVNSSKPFHKPLHRLLAHGSVGIVKQRNDTEQYIVLNCHVFGDHKRRNNVCAAVALSETLLYCRYVLKKSSKSLYNRVDTPPLWHQPWHPNYIHRSVNCCTVSKMTQIAPHIDKANRRWLDHPMRKLSKITDSCMLYCLPCIVMGVNRWVG
jgi:hypothetical protein